LSKLRLVHKGLEVLDELEGAPALGATPAENQFEYINTTSKPNPFDDYGSFMKSAPAKQPFFKMMDVPAQS
jgi:hypothetical protein